MAFLEAIKNNHIEASQLLLKKVESAETIQEALLHVSNPSHQNIVELMTKHIASLEENKRKRKCVIF